MDFNLQSWLSDIIASCIYVVRTIVRLIIKPYATMRSLAQDFDIYQIFIIFLSVYGYFVYARIIRLQSFHVFLASSSAVISFVYFVLTFLLVMLFTYAVGCVLVAVKAARPRPFRALVMLSAYSLLPTLIWFLMTSTLFVLVPPPRNPTFLGMGFSMVFIVLSTTLLLWRLVLWYLTLRFYYRAQFYTIVIVMLVFMGWFVPYSIVMYHNDIVRSPRL